MPFSVKHIRCRVDPDLDEALFDFQERLGDQYLGAQAVLEELETIRASVEADLLDPLKSDLDQVLAVANTSTEEMEDAMSLVGGDTPEDVEFSIGERYDINVINGRVIPDGDFDISALQSLTRLAGSIDAVLTHIPEIEDIPIDIASDRSFRELVEFSPRFLFVTTYMKQTIVPATKCSPELVIEEEITAGVEIPLSAAAASVGVEEEDLRIYIFWIGDPDASSRLRLKARSMGLTNAQFVQAVSLRSTTDFIVEKIDDPMDILRLLAAFGSDIDSVLERARGPIELFEDSHAVVESLRDLFGRSSGGAGPSGFRDFSSPAANLLSVIDIDKTFKLTETFDAIGDYPEGGPATQFVAGLTAAIKSQLFALTSILAQAQGLLQSVLTELANLQSIVFNIFSDLSNGLLDCLFGGTFSPSLGFPPIGSPGVGIGGIGGSGTPGTPGVPTANPLEGLINTIEGQSTLVRQFTNTMNELFGSISSISCSGGFLAGALGGSNAFPGTFMDCQSQQLADQGLEIPDFALDAMGVVKEVMDFISSLFDFATSNLRNLRMTAISLGQSLRSTLASRSDTPATGTGSGGCAPPEAAALAAVLQQRAIEAFSSDVGL